MSQPGGRPNTPRTSQYTHEPQRNILDLTSPTLESGAVASHSPISEESPPTPLFLSPLIIDKGGLREPGGGRSVSEEAYSSSGSSGYRGSVGKGGGRRFSDEEEEEDGFEEDIPLPEESGSERGDTGSEDSTGVILGESKGDILSEDRRIYRSSIEQREKEFKAKEEQERRRRRKELGIDSDESSEENEVAPRIDGKGADDPGEGEETTPETIRTKRSDHSRSGTVTPIASSPSISKTPFPLLDEESKVKEAPLLSPVPTTKPNSLPSSPRSKLPFSTATAGLNLLRNAGIGLLPFTSAHQSTSTPLSDPEKSPRRTRTLSTPASPPSSSKTKGLNDSSEMSSTKGTTDPRGNGRNNQLPSPPNTNSDGGSYGSGSGSVRQANGTGNGSGNVDRERLKSLARLHGSDDSGVAGLRSSRGGSNDFSGSTGANFGSVKGKERERDREMRTGSVRAEGKASGSSAKMGGEGGEGDESRRRPSRGTIFDKDRNERMVNEINSTISPHGSPLPSPTIQNSPPKFSLDRNRGQASPPKPPRSRSPFKGPSMKRSSTNETISSSASGASGRTVTSTNSHTRTVSDIIPPTTRFSGKDFRDGGPLSASAIPNRSPSPTKEPSTNPNSVRRPLRRSLGNDALYGRSENGSLRQREHTAERLYRGPSSNDGSGGSIASGNSESMRRSRTGWSIPSSRDYEANRSSISLASGDGYNSIRSTSTRPIDLAEDRRARRTPTEDDPRTPLPSSRFSTESSSSHRRNRTYDSERSMERFATASSANELGAMSGRRTPGGSGSYDARSATRSESTVAIESPRRRSFSTSRRNDDYHDDPRNHRSQASLDATSRSARSSISRPESRLEQDDHPRRGGTDRVGDTGSSRLYERRSRSEGIDDSVRSSYSRSPIPPVPPLNLKAAGTIRNRPALPTAFRNADRGGAPGHRSPLSSTGSMSPRGELNGRDRPASSSRRTPELGFARSSETRSNPSEKSERDFSSVRRVISTATRDHAYVATGEGQAKDQHSPRPPRAETLGRRRVGRDSLAGSESSSADKYRYQDRGGSGGSAISSADPVYDDLDGEELVPSPRKRTTSMLSGRAANQYRESSDFDRSNSIPNSPSASARYTALTEDLKARKDRLRELDEQDRWNAGELVITKSSKPSLVDPSLLDSEDRPRGAGSGAGSSAGASGDGRSSRSRELAALRLTDRDKTLRSTNASQVDDDEGLGYADPGNTSRASQDHGPVSVSSNLGHRRSRNEANHQESPILPRSAVGRAHTVHLTSSATPSSAQVGVKSPGTATRENEEHHRLLYDALETFTKHFASNTTLISSTSPAGIDSPTILPESADLSKRMAALVSATTRLNSGLKTLVASAVHAQVDAELDESKTGLSVATLVQFERAANQLSRSSDEQVRSLTEGLIAFTRVERERDKARKEGDVPSRPLSRLNSPIKPTSPEGQSLHSIVAMARSKSVNTTGSRSARRLADGVGLAIDNLPTTPPNQAVERMEQESPSMAGSRLVRSPSASTVPHSRDVGSGRPGLDMRAPKGSAASQLTIRPSTSTSPINRFPRSPGTSLSITQVNATRNGSPTKSGKGKAVASDSDDADATSPPLREMHSASDILAENSETVPDGPPTAPYRRHTVTASSALAFKSLATAEDTDIAVTTPRPRRSMDLVSNTLNSSRPPLSASTSRLDDEPSPRTPVTQANRTGTAARILNALSLPRTKLRARRNTSGSSDPLDGLVGVNPEASQPIEEWSIQGTGRPDKAERQRRRESIARRVGSIS